MSLELPSVAMKQLPSRGAPERSVEGWTEFSALEWNALVNRARALIQALRVCQGDRALGDPCRNCPMGGADSGGQASSSVASCRPGFRAIEHRLAHLANQGTPSQRQQLRRTVDSLHLAYRELDREG